MLVSVFLPSYRVVVERVENFLLYETKHMKKITMTTYYPGVTSAHRNFPDSVFKEFNQVTN